MSAFKKMKVCLFDGVEQSAIDVFTKAGFENIKLFPDSLPESELKKELSDAHIVGLRSKTSLSKDILDAAPELIAIGRYGIGVDNVDLEAAEKKGIPVFNGPHSSTRSVAEIVIGNVFTLSRKIGKFNQQLHTGEWKKTAKGCHQIKGKTLGLIGYGNISSQVSIMAEALGMNVIYSDVRTVLPFGNAVQVTFDEVLKNADFISLHVPGGKATEKMINSDTIAKMKDGVRIINYARGSVIDIPALKTAIESGKVAGAALDVFPKEPKKGKAFVSELIGLEEVILTPHIGGATEESQTALGTEVSEKMKNFAVLGDSATALNFPPIIRNNPREGDHRIFVAHKNQAGALAHINDIVAESGANISGEILKTSPNIGVVIIDIEQDFSNDVFEKINTLESTIKARIIC